MPTLGPGTAMDESAIRSCDRSRPGHQTSKCKCNDHIGGLLTRWLSFARPTRKMFRNGVTPQSSAHPGRSPIKYSRSEHLPKLLQLFKGRTILPQYDSILAPPPKPHRPLISVQRAHVKAIPPLAPIQTAPAEIILQFFYWYAAQEPIPVPWEFTQSPLAVLHVCSSWRHLAMTEPELWRNLLISLNLKSEHFRDMLEHTLLRSNGQRLSIQIRGDRIPRWIETFTNLMLPIWERIIGFNVIWRGPNSPVPNELRCFYEGPNPAFMLPPCLHQLSELVLDGVAFPLELLFQLLRATHSLEKLVWRPRSSYIDPAQIPFFEPMSPVLLMKLKHMTLQVHNFPLWHTQLDSILTRISAPCLTHLALICFDQVVQKQSWVEELDLQIRRFSRSLISLRADMDIPSFLLEEILLSCNGLKELIVPYGEVLSLRIGVPLPNLERLVFNGGRHLSKYLIRLEYRGAIAVRRGRGLRNVIVIWDGIDDIDEESLDVLARIERLKEGGMQIAVYRPEDVDCEMDLDQKIH